jgi:5'(3')-deoxyribonucleotidase
MNRVFIDLDNVLTDFDRQLADLLDKPLERGWDFGNDPKIWKKIDTAGEEFWAKMKFMSDGQELWDAVKKYKPTILTAPSRHPSSTEGKKLWLKENLPDVPYIIDSKKQSHAKDGCILIDDREKNIKKWEDAGGIGILHKDAESSIKKLEEIMNDKKKEASNTLLRDSSDYSKYVYSTPKNGGEYYTLRIPKDITPPNEGVHLNIGGIDLVVFTVSTPEDIAKGRGGPVAQSMIRDGIGYSVNCLPNNHEYLRKETLSSIIPRMDVLASELEAVGLIKEAYFIDKLSGAWEDYLKGGPGKVILKRMLKPFWGTNEKRVMLVTDALDSIARGLVKTDIPQEKLEEVENLKWDIKRLVGKDFSSEVEKEAARKDLYNKAFNISMKIAELVGLLLVTPTNSMEWSSNENEISKLTKNLIRVQPQSKGILQSEFGRSKMFSEMARREANIDLSGLSESHLKIVTACLERVIVSALEKEATLDNYFLQLIQYMRLQKRSAQDVAERIMKGLELWPPAENTDRNAIKIAAWKKALTIIGKTPEGIMRLLQSFRLTSKEIGQLIMPIPELAPLAGETAQSFIAKIDGKELEPNSQPPPGNNRNPVKESKRTLGI